jgi:hypothetical protein
MGEERIESWKHNLLVFEWNWEVEEEIRRRGNGARGPLFWPLRERWRAGWLPVELSQLSAL